MAEQPDFWIGMADGATNADAAERDRFEDGDLDLLYVAEAAPRPELLPAEWDVQRFSERTRARIAEFIAEHVHSWVPDGYHDQDGRLDIIVGNIRFHHAGKAGISERAVPRHRLHHRVERPARLGGIPRIRHATATVMRPDAALRREAGRRCGS